MNHSKGTALITAVRNMETTVRTLAADSAVSAERALNAAIVDADITRGFEEYLTRRKQSTSCWSRTSIPITSAV